MTQNSPTVFVIDDDQLVRESIAWLLRSVNLQAVLFSNGDEFLGKFNPELPGCLIVDLRMPGTSGLALIEYLATQPVRPPAVVITAYGTVPSATRAMRAGAVNILEKPFDDQELLDAVQEAIERDARERAAASQRRMALERLARLTPREREVLNLMIQGRPNKTMARELNVSKKSIEFHRANVMRKLEVDNFAELMKLTLPALPLN